MRLTPLLFLLVACGSIEPPPPSISALDYYAPVVSVQVEFAGERVLDASRPLCTPRAFGRRVGFTVAFGASDHLALVDVEAEPTLLPRATDITLTELPGPDAMADFQAAYRGFLHERFLDDCCPRSSSNGILCEQPRATGFTCATPRGIDDATRAAMARVLRQSVTIHVGDAADVALASGPARIAVTLVGDERVRCPGWLASGLAW